jgi:hypothetical protein
MKSIPNRACVVALAILVAGLGGALSLWLFRGDEAREFDRLKATALCVLDLPEGTASVFATFTITRPVETLHVGFRRSERRERFSISISGGEGVVASASGVKADSFSFGRGLHPGTYTVTLGQEIKGKGALAVISAERPVYVTGWQIWSRTYLGLLVLSGFCVLLGRNAESAKTRALSLTAFHSLLLGLVLIFIYLLFHEGGHALAQLYFGCYDFARSDFWGIHGHPHSGGTMASLEPWQHTVISCAGPMLPTVAGFAFFLLWGLPIGRKLRSLRPIINLYFSAIVAILVFSEAVLGPAYLLGIVTAEGDLVGRVTDAAGPVWLAKGLLWGAFLFSAFILWRAVPELQRAWRAQFLEPWKSPTP